MSFYVRRLLPTTLDNVPMADSIYLSGESPLDGLTPEMRHKAWPSRPIAATSSWIWETPLIEPKANQPFGLLADPRRQFVDVRDIGRQTHHFRWGNAP
jgi:hypothetical protein